MDLLIVIGNVFFVIGIEIVGFIMFLFFCMGIIGLCFIFGMVGRLWVMSLLESLVFVLLNCCCCLICCRFNF